MEMYMSDDELTMELIIKVKSSIFDIKNIPVLH